MALDTYEPTDDVLESSWALMNGDRGSWLPDEVKSAARAASVTDATPQLLIDPQGALQTANELRQLLGEVRYAVKAGPYAPIVEALAKAGHGFDVASSAETELVVSCGGKCETVLCSNPAMSPREVRAVLGLGVRWFVTDSIEHSAQIVEQAAVLGIAPGDIELLVRLSLKDPSARITLSEKFGVPTNEAEGIVADARNRGLKVRGLSFHLGSQAGSKNAAAAASRTTLALVRRLGIKDPVIDVGGGFAAPYVGAPDWRKFAEGFAEPLRDSEVEVLCEPGRVVATSGTWLVATVIAVSTRNKTRFIHLDAGAYHGLMEMSSLSTHPFMLPMAFGGPGATGDFVAGRMVGPTCDSLDTLFGGDVPVPTGLSVGDTVVFGHAGAYSITCSSPFNGFAVPNVGVVSA